MEQMLPLPPRMARLCSRLVNILGPGSTNWTVIFIVGAFTRFGNLLVGRDLATRFNPSQTHIPREGHVVPIGFPCGSQSVLNLW